MTIVDTPAGAVGHETGSRRRPGAWWLADRQTLWTCAVLLPILLGLAAYGVVSEYDLWRYEYPRAADRAGLYLFFSGPVLAALCCWNAYRWRTTLRGVLDGLPAPGLVARASWVPVAIAALVMHTMVLLVHLGTARFSGAVGVVDWRPVVVQFLSVAACCALGALIGNVSRSNITAPFLLLAMLAANTLLAQWGFRRFTQVGTGAADFVDLRYAGEYLWPKAVLFASLILLALPLRWTAWSWWLDRGRAVVLLTAVAVSAATVWTYSGPMLEVRAEPRVCQGAAPEICVPRSMAARRQVVDEAVRQAVAALQAGGVTAGPNRLDVISRAATMVPRGEAGLLVSGATLHDPRAVRREVARAFSAAQMCDDMTAVAPPAENIMVARATIDGWLQTHTDSAEDGTFPPELVAALERGTEAEQHKALNTLFTAVWSCSPTVVPPR